MINWDKPIGVKGRDDFIVKVLDKNLTLATGETCVLLKVSSPHFDRIVTRTVENSLPANPKYPEMVFENTPVIDNFFHPLDKLGFPLSVRSLVLLSMVWADHPTARYALEITRQDGKPVQVKLHERPTT